MVLTRTLLFILAITANATALANDQPTVKVVDSVSLTAISGAEVLAIQNGIAEVEATASTGYAELQHIEAPGVADFDTYLRVVPTQLLVEEPGYFPIQRLHRFVSGDSRAHIQLTPKGQGSLSPMIQAALGGRLQLNGLGVLNVPAGVLSQDARVRLVPVAPQGFSMTGVDQEHLFEVWMRLEDAFGNEIQQSVVASDGITLTINPARFNLALGAGGDGRLVRHFDLGWSLLEESPLVVGADSSALTMALVTGMSTLIRDAGTLERPVAGGDPECGEWGLELFPLTSSLPRGPVSSVNRGVYANTISVSVREGETIVTGFTLGAEVFGEGEAGVGVLFKKLSVKAGVQILGDDQSSMAVTTMSQGSKGTPPSGTVNGVSQSALAPPFSCVTGTAKYGTSIVTYRMFATRKCVHPDGSITNENVVIGEVGIPNAIVIDWNVEVDESCAGCEGVEPPDMPL